MFIVAITTYLFSLISIHMIFFMQVSIMDLTLLMTIFPFLLISVIIISLCSGPAHDYISDIILQEISEG